MTQNGNTNVDYEEYTRLEKHLNLSRLLHGVSYKGMEALAMLGKTHNIKLKRSKLKNDIYKVFATITHTIKPRKSLCNNIFSSMVYYMDEVMFREVQHLDNFFIEDYCYSLNKVYYNPREWLEEGEQLVRDDQASDTTDEEVLHMLTNFFDTYDAMLDDIRDHVGYMHKSDKLKKKIFRVISRIRTKHKAALDILRENGLKICET
jgi:hypothetical protein